MQEENSGSSSDSLLPRFDSLSVYGLLASKFKTSFPAFLHS